MPHQAVILIGPPGAGKDTQAELLSEDYGFVQIKSSKIIEEKFASADPNDEVINREKETFKAGKLNTPELVEQWIMEVVEKCAAQGQSIVFSGSPRTLHEAESEGPRLEQLYGKENVHVVDIKVSEEDSVKRNVGRRVCKLNRHPIPDFDEFKDMTICPKDGSELIKRGLDTEETMRVRYKVYLDQTEPVLDYFRQQGYNIVEVNGEQSIRGVHNDIVAGMHQTAHPDLEKTT